MKTGVLAILKTEDKVLERERMRIDEIINVLRSLKIGTSRTERDAIEDAIEILEYEKARDLV